MPHFMKYDSVLGEATDRAHQGWIEVSSYSWGISQTDVGSSGAPGGPGKTPSTGEITVTKKSDSTSPLLLQRLNEKGESLIIDPDPATRKPRLEISEAVISSIRRYGPIKGHIIEEIKLTLPKR